MTADVELLSCPFCGVAAAEVGGLVPWAQCLACDATGPQRESEADAVAAWNHRAAAAQAAEIESLRAEVERLKDAARSMVAEIADRQGEAVQHKRRAERLAEALREIERRMPKDRAGPSWIARTIAAEALHPTAAQEGNE